MNESLAMDQLSRYFTIVCCGCGSVLFGKRAGWRQAANPRGFGLGLYVFVMFSSPGAL